MRTIALFLATSLPAFAGASATVPVDKNLVQVALEAGSFKTLATALTEAELVAALQGDGPFTVFAPTDEAFAKLPKGTLEELLRPENRDRLTSILTYHVVPGRVLASGAVTAGEAKTLEGSELGFAIREGRLFADDSRVVQNDIEASNGVIHVIDQVLLPPSAKQPAGRKVIGVYLDSPSKALAAQLGVDRSSTLLISRLVSGGNSEKAGLERYDVITSIDGHPATNEALARAKEKRGVGGEVRLEVLRRGERRSFHVTVGLDPH